MANCDRGWQGYPTRQTEQPTKAGYPTLRRIQLLTVLPYPADRVTRPRGSPHLSCNRDQEKIKDYTGRRVAWFVLLFSGQRFTSVFIFTIRGIPLSVAQHFTKLL